MKIVILKQFHLINPFSYPFISYCFQSFLVVLNMRMETELSDLTNSTSLLFPFCYKKIYNTEYVYKLKKTIMFILFFFIVKMYRQVLERSKTIALQ